MDTLKCAKVFFNHYLGKNRRSMESFFRTHKYLIEHLQPTVRRDLMDEINWKDRMIGVKGARGVGKTTFRGQSVAHRPSVQAAKLESRAERVLRPLSRAQNRFRWFVGHAIERGES